MKISRIIVSITLLLRWLGYTDSITISVSSNHFFHIPAECP